ncbi:MAG: hypothetical protein HUU37_07625 [Bdellovibrionales bacterium]|nr:hypothetical protein [Bdellovibrionales bacterium]
MKRGLALTAVFLSLGMAPRARAMTVGDAILTVGVSTAAGAVLGASTLPFYNAPSEHVRNVFYGAAIGTVAGVFITAMAGMQSTEMEEEAGLLREPPEQYRLARTEPPRSATLPSRPSSLMEAAGAGAVWSPVYRVRF